MFKKQFFQNFDPWRSIKNGDSQSGSLSGSYFERILGSVCEKVSDFECDLRCGVDGTSTPFITLQLSGKLTLICQRCLEQMDFAVETELKVSPVHSEEEADKVLAEYDPLVVTEKTVDLLALVEDELILSIPAAPKHPPEDCSAQSIIEQSLVGDVEVIEERENPFKMLESLKSSSKGQGSKN